MSMQEVYRSSVQTWESDQMGHMNVQFYLDKAQAGLATLGHYIGLGPRLLKEKGWVLTARDHHVRFLREQRPGAPFFIRGGIAEIHEDHLVVYEEMINTVSGDVAATFRAEAVLVDGKSRAPLSFPKEALQKAEDVKTDIPAHGAFCGLEMTAPRPAPSLQDAEAMGMVRTYMGEVMPDWCDAHGYMTKRHFMGVVSDSIPNLLAATRGDDRSANSKTGGAALEYRFIYRGAPKEGDLLTLCSGLKTVTDKTYTWCHWLFDTETGNAVATAEAVAIALDLEARKAIPIPREMKAHLESLVIGGLGV